MDVELETAGREELLALVRQLLERITVLEARVIELEAENEQVRQQLGKKQAPHWAKSNRPQPPEPRPPRRKRAPEHNHGRGREGPNRVEYHPLDRC